MPVSGPQTPGFWLPGSEYLNLAPNAHIALQGRRRGTADSGVVSVPADGVGQIVGNKLLETNFTQTSAIYVADVWLQILPQDQASELTVKSSLLTVTTGNPPFGYNLGIPVATLITPLGSIVIQRDQDKLILARDVRAFSTAASTNLSLAFEVWFSNEDPSAAHSIEVVAGIIYTRLDGLQE